MQILQITADTGVTMTIVQAAGLVVFFSSLLGVWFNFKNKVERMQQTIKNQKEFFEIELERVNEKIKETKEDIKDDFNDIKKFQRENNDILKQMHTKLESHLSYHKGQEK